MRKASAETYLDPWYERPTPRFPDPLDQPSLFDTDPGGTTDSESIEPSSTSTTTGTDPSGSEPAA